MEIEVSLVVEEGMDSHCHIMAYAHDSSECVRAEAEMCILAHVLECLALLLHRIVCTAEAVYLDAVALDFRCLSLTLALHKSACCADTCTCSHLLEDISIKLVYIAYDLHIIYSRTIVKGDEVNSLAAAVGAYPPFYADILAELCAFKDVYDFCSFHR